MKRISVEAFQEVIEAEGKNASVAFINVCTPEEYQAKHIAGVKSMPLDQLSARYRELAKKSTIYVHCRSGARSQRAIDELMRLGVRGEFVNVEGGLMAWESAGLATVAPSGKTTFPITQQVFIAAGSFVLLGVGLSLFVDGYFIALSGFVGAGLLFAGITGWCGMAVVLSRMPWNKS